MFKMKRTPLVIKAEGQCDADKPCNPHKFEQSYVTDTSSHALGDHLRPEVLSWPLIGQRLEHRPLIGHPAPQAQSSCGKVQLMHFS